MPTSEKITRTVSVADIARHLDVPATNVSSWRRRSLGTDNPFPARLESSTDARPRFDFDEVAGWYRRQFPERDFGAFRGGDAQGLWSALLADAENSDDARRARKVGTATRAALRRDVAAGKRIAWNGLQLSVPTGPMHASLDEWIPADITTLVAQVDPSTNEAYSDVTTQIDGMSRDRLTQFVSGLCSDQLVGADAATAATSPELSRLMLSLAGDDPASILDPACGSGGLLLAAAGRFPAAALCGIDTDPTLVAIARCRAYLLGANARFDVGDGFHSNPDGATWDLILVDPPIGLAVQDDQLEQLAQMQPNVAKDVRSAPDLAWLVLAATMIQSSGNAVILAPASSLHRAGARERIRNELVGRGQIDTVLALPDTDNRGAGADTDPRRLRRYVRLPLSIWKLSAQDQSTQNVTLIDGSEFVGTTPDDTVSRLIAACSTDEENRLPGVSSIPIRQLLRPGRTLLPAEWRPVEDDASIVAERERKVREATAHRKAVVAALPSGGGDLRIARQLPEKVSLLRTGEVFAGRYVRPENARTEPTDGYLREVGVDAAVRYVPRPRNTKDLLAIGDVLIDARAGGARVWNEPENAVANSSTIVLRPHAGYRAQYLALVLSSLLTAERALLSTKRLDPRIIQVPTLSLEEQDSIVEHLASLQTTIAALQEAHTAATTAFQAALDLIALGAARASQPTRKDADDH